jgi:hypothetical protein
LEHITAILCPFGILVSILVYVFYQEKSGNPDTNKVQHSALLDVGFLKCCQDRLTLKQGANPETSKSTTTAPALYAVGQSVF